MKRKFVLRLSSSSRHRIGDGLLAIGLLILLGVALFWAQSALAAQQVADQYYLISRVDMDLPLPTPASMSEQRRAAALQPTQPYLLPTEVILQPPLMATPTPLPAEVSSPTPATESTEQPTPPVEAASTALPSPTPLPPLPTPTPARVDTGPAVRLVIPGLGVDRAVVPLGMKPDSSGILQWDTESLFATRNRGDLVGQMVASLNPGMGGNTILVGHNYDQGTYVWEGVFVNLKNIQPGAKIIVYTQGGAELHYVVQLVKKVPWRDQSNAEWEKHLKFLGPSETDRLTLVTCGGANIWPWPARIYVVAVPDG